MRMICILVIFGAQFGAFESESLATSHTEQHNFGVLSAVKQAPATLPKPRP